MKTPLATAVPNVASANGARRSLCAATIAPGFDDFGEGGGKFATHRFPLLPPKNHTTAFYAPRENATPPSPASKSSRPSRERPRSSRRSPLATGHTVRDVDSRSVTTALQIRNPLISNQRGRAEGDKKEGGTSLSPPRASSELRQLRTAPATTPRRCSVGSAWRKLYSLGTDRRERLGLIAKSPTEGP